MSVNTPKVRLGLGNYSIIERHNMLDLLFLSACEKHSISYSHIFWELRDLKKDE